MQRDRTQLGFQEQAAKLVTTWRDAFNRGDAATVGVMYAQDCALQLATGELLEGRSAIRGWVEGGAGAGMRFDNSVDEAALLSGGAEAFNLGTYRLLTPDGTPLREGHWHALLKRDGDERKIYRQIAAVSAPPLEG